jgi:hypothetical protein
MHGQVSCVRKRAGARVALVGLLAGVDSHMHQKITPLIELLAAVTAFELLDALPIMLWLNQRAALSSTLHRLLVLSSLS